MIDLQPVVAAEVLEVVDGDTFKARAFFWPYQTYSGSVRVIGLDTPELHSKCAAEREKAQEARSVAHVLFKGQTVYLLEVQDDVYPGRVDAVVLLPDGRNWADILVAEGLARYYDGKTKRKPWCTEDGSLLKP